MDAGDELRLRTGGNDAAVLNGLEYLQRERQGLSGSRDTPMHHVVYVVHSIKTPKEIDTLRSIYGGRFLTLSVFTPRATRVGTLAKRIADSRHSHRSDEFRAVAEKLLYRDEVGVVELPHGQNTGDAFAHGDVFVDASTLQRLKQTLHPFFQVLFEHPFITPTRDESGMYHAYAASLRSSSLSRQVGAAITTAEGELLAVGCNDAPKYGGGLYWRGDDPDGRDFQLFPEDPSQRKRENDISRMYLSAS